jgi:hypothetical protein
MATCIHTDDWDLIVKRIYNGTCVPFLGAAVKIKNDKLNYEGLPLGSEVAYHLIEEALDLKNIEPSQLAPVTPHEKLAKAERYKELAKSSVQNLARVSLIVEFDSADRQDFMDRVRAILPDKKREPSLLLNTLAELPFELIVTTNYDNLMERALKQRSREVKAVIQPIHGFDDTAQNNLITELADFAVQQRKKPNPNERGVILYKIHGSFVDDQDEDKSLEVIITEEDYIEFLTVVGQKDGGVPTQIKARMKDRTLLFLGYSLEDWDFRTIFKGLVEPLGRRERLRSFALQKDSSSFWRDYWKNKEVIIYNLDLYEFAEELREKYATYVQSLAK